MPKDSEQIEKVLTRGVANILPSQKELASLMAEEKITLYQGFDPSSEDLHLGNWIGIRKLAQFQELGHKVIFLIGDFTGMIGDPTDKSAARKKLSHKQAVENAKNYTKQVEKTLKFTGPNAAEVKYNSEWLSKLSFEDIVEIASNFTVQQILERDFYQERLKKNKPIHLHEFLYPLMQGYDCVAMDVDLEIGATDQLFNMLAGRHLMKSLKDKDKFVLTMKLLTDSSGAKMGKTTGNVINLSDAPEIVYGKIMSLSDDILELGIELLTDLPLEEAEGKPMEVKKKLAHNVVEQLHDKGIADKAQVHFEKTFSEGEPEYKNPMPPGPLVRSAAQASGASITQVKRLISAGSVDINGGTVTDPTIELTGGEEVRIGKTGFYKVEK